MWQLTRWYEKTVYVIGWIALVIWTMAFVYGFVYQASLDGQTAQPIEQQTSNSLGVLSKPPIVPGSPSYSPVFLPPVN